MAAVGGMLAAAILKVVSDQIGSVIGGQIKLQMNFNEELKKMKDMLETVDAVLKDAERRSITDRSTLLWLKRLKDFLYAISDMIDEFEADTQTITQPSACKFSFKKYLANMTPCLTIGPKITMPSKMKKMSENLKVITDQYNEFKLPEDTDANGKVTDIRETSSTLETHIIKRTKEKESILASLFGNMTNEITILPIYGIGGLGKTTLAKMVYNSPQFNGYSLVWVYVSQTFDLKKIGNSIISQLSEKGNESGYAEMQVINNSLRKLLAKTNILIVLDDMWEKNIFELEKLKGMLKVGESSKVVVIVTTRYECIAKDICTIQVQPHKLAPLTDDQCWNIIKQRSDFKSRNDRKELRYIGKDIARKCQGMALAAQSLGHMLHSLTIDEWESVRNSEFWNLSDSEDTGLTHVLASLKLSYSAMPSYLKICFAYCAIFPKGYTIVKDDLIHQWISLGFIKEASKVATWQLGERCIRQLLGLSFLENSKSALMTGVNFENDALFTMHDLVHELARLVMLDEILVASKQDNSVGSCCHFALLNEVMVDEILVASKQGKSTGSCCHFAWLNGCQRPLELSKIRALRFMDCDKIKHHDAAFSSAKSLRVLDLSECSIHKLPDFVGVLKQLRYLNAPRVQDANIPDSITKLSKLIYLNLHGSPKLLALPESIGEIEGLMHLDLSSCLGLEKLPESFSKLKELVHLNLSNCSAIGGISVFLGSLTQLHYLNLSHCPNIGEMPEALGGLSKLKYLNLSFSSYLNHWEEADFLGTLTKLEYLNLSSEHPDLQKLPGALGGFTQGRYLNLPDWWNVTESPRFFGSLKNLVHLDVSQCQMVDLHEALVGLTNLQYLNLKGTYLRSLPNDLTKLRYLNLSSLGHMSDSFINDISSNLFDLEHLDLSGNKYLVSIPESISSLRKLHTLDLSECTSLQKIPKSIHTIGTLKFVHLMGCPFLSGVPQLGGSVLSLPHFPVHASDGESSSNLVLLQATDPIELKITQLENAKSMGEAHRIKLMEKQSLEDLKLEWTQDVVRFVDDKMLLEKLVPPSTLKKLEICGYNSVSFPAWLMGQLPNLESLVLKDMANLEEWNTSYSSGEEYLIQHLEIHHCPMLRMKPPLPKAEYWEISHSDNVLSSWEECTVSHTTASSSSPRTTAMSVTSCKVPMHQWRLLQHFPGLLCLLIRNCSDLTSSPEITRHLSSLKALCLIDEGMEKLPKWLGEVTSLQNVEIRGINGVKELNENMRQLTMLQSLNLLFCHNLSLPHWLGELTSLNNIVVHFNDVLRSLPESIQQLTNLQRLEINQCPTLEHVVAESEDGRRKLADNQEMVCLLPRSLKELTINHCEGIKSFPEGIQQLTNLQKLKIYSCPGLQQWCELEENKMKLAGIEDKVEPFILDLK